jgi:hypothetical protein
MKKKLLLALCALLAAASLFAQNTQKTGLPDVLLGNWEVVLPSQEGRSDEEWTDWTKARISEFSILADTYMSKATVRSKWIKDAGWKIIDVTANPDGTYTAIVLTEQGEGGGTPPGYYGKMTLYLNEFPQTCIDEWKKSAENFKDKDNLDYYINEINGRPFFVMLNWSIVNKKTSGHSKNGITVPVSELLDLLESHGGKGFWFSHFYDLDATPLENEVGTTTATLKPQPATMMVFVKGNE